MLDRQTPVARLVPYGAEPSGLVVQRPLPGAPRIQDVKLPAPVKLDFDVVDLLLEERQGDR